MPGNNRKLFHAAHYNVIAKRIREARLTYHGFDEAQSCLDFLALGLAEWFSEDNPRFERDTWLTATETQEELKSV